MNDADALLAANAAYYRAFSARDHDAMSALWAQECVSCVHPGWPALLGRPAVLASYRDIFRNPRQEPISCSDEKALLDGDDGRVFCVESVGGGLLVAANWFRRGAEGWSLIHHQASPLVLNVEKREPRRSLH